MNHITYKWVLMRYHQTKFGCKRIISSEDRVELESKKQSYFDFINIHCDLDLEDRNRTFHSTLHLMMMHHNTKFGYKQLSGSEEDSCWIKLHTWARQMDTVIPVYSPNFEGGWGVGGGTKIVFLQIMGKCVKDS